MATYIILALLGILFGVGCFFTGFHRGLQKAKKLIEDSGGARPVDTIPPTMVCELIRIGTGTPLRAFQSPSANGGPPRKILVDLGMVELGSESIGTKYTFGNRRVAHVFVAPTAVTPAGKLVAVVPTAEKQPIETGGEAQK